MTMKNNKKVLYFEGAGCEGTKRNDIDNCRIRTAFTNNDGRQIYLEFTSCEVTKNSKKNMHQGYEVGDVIGFIDFAFYIDTESKDPCNECRIKELNRRIKFKYCKSSLVKLINEQLNCGFDTIEVLPIYEGYRVHGDNHTYNLIDNHEVNIPRAVARKKAYNKVDMEYRQMLNEKYSKIGMYEMNEDNIKIRCHASTQSMIKADLTEEDRIKTIEVIY